MVYKKTTYMNNNALCILVYKNDDLYCDVTVNLNSHLQKDNRAYLHINNIPKNVLKDVEKHLTYLNIYAESGFMMYPLVEFDPIWLDGLENA